jgi:tricorn protease
VWDDLHFDLGFPRGVKPYIVLLRRDLHFPFLPEPKVHDEKEENGNKKPLDEETKEENGQASEKKDEKRITIDLEGITDRVLPFPVAEGRYRRIQGGLGKVLFLDFPVVGERVDPFQDRRGWIDAYDFATQKVERILEGVNSFVLSRNTQMLLARNAHGLRAIKTGEKPKENGDRSSRETGWLDLNRITVSVYPAAEWKQMFAEAWRLQQEQFWDQDMAGIDWKVMRDRYEPLLERVSTRSEFSDLLWELQGELGTSHAYESGGAYRRSPSYHQGFLGVDWSYDTEGDRYRIASMVRGDPSDSAASSPLLTPGLNVSVGDTVLSINGQRLSVQRGPQEVLVNQAGNEVQLAIEDAKTQETRMVTVKALFDEMPAR